MQIDTLNFQLWPQEERYSFHQAAKVWITSPGGQWMPTHMVGLQKTEVTLLIF